jgi:AcrR family transcriptional regulator
MTRPRDAAKTRQLLLEAALRRFAREGYAATTVRDIAEDAGVNVALIARYFESKEGLYATALREAVDELGRESGRVPLSKIPEAIATRVAGSGSSGAENGPDLLLLLLLRSTRNERTERLRLGVLRRFSEGLATAAGWDKDDDQLVLRAELVLATAIGITLLRYSRLEPLTSAHKEHLVEPLRDIVKALLRD